MLNSVLPLALMGEVMTLRKHADPEIENLHVAVWSFVFVVFGVPVAFLMVILSLLIAAFFA